MSGSICSQFLFAPTAAGVATVAGIGAALGAGNIGSLLAWKTKYLR